MKNYLSNQGKENFGNYITNPPYINKCLYSKEKEDIYFALLNGVVISLKSNLKSRFIKKIHNGGIRDIKLSNTDAFNLLTLGRDKCIKSISSEGDIMMSIDLSDFPEEDPSIIESNTEEAIFYLDQNSQTLKIIKIKN